MKLLIILSMLFAGSAFAADGKVTCSFELDNLHGTITKVGEVTLEAGQSGTIESSNFSALTYVSAVCESEKPCTGYKLTSIVTNGEDRLVIKGDYTNEEAGKVISGVLVNESANATSTCTVL